MYRRFLWPANLVMTPTGLLTGVLIYAILRRVECSELTSLVGMALFYVNKEILVTSVGGMETPLVICLMALSLLALMGRHNTLALVLCSVLILTRIDSHVWSSLVFGGICLRDRRVPYRSALIRALVILPWVVFAVSYFGTVIPHALVAKRAIGGVSTVSLLSLDAFSEFAKWYTIALGYGHPWRFVLWATVLLVGALKWFRDDDDRLSKRLVICYPILYGLFLCLGRAPGFHWYAAPPLFCCILLSAVGGQLARPESLLCPPVRTTQACGKVNTGIRRTKLARDASLANG